MIAPALLTCLSALIVLAMTRLGTLDHPGARSSHTLPTPKGGGVGIVVAFLLGLTGLWLRAPALPLLALGAATAGLAIVSYLDDVRSWPFSIKLAAQLAACGVAIAGGIRLQVVQVPGLGAVALGWLGVPLTAAWMMFATNAINFIDGLNGLAAGTAAIACAMLAWIATGQQDPVVRGAALALGAGIVGFLPFNYPRARIFMGDVGSQPCGFVLASLGVLAAGFAPQTQSVLLVPMMLFGVLWDVAFTLVRRTLAGARITQAHRGHLYQVAQRSGVPAWAVSVVYWGMTAWGGACAVIFASRPQYWAGLLGAIVTPQIGWMAFVWARARRARTVW